MKFKNIKTGEIKEVSGYALEFAYSHNSNWEEYKEPAKKKEKKEE